MTCDKCEHFKIVYEPQRINGVILEMGRAHCKKYDFVVDFVNHGKFKRLECPDKEGMSELKLKPCPFCGGEMNISCSSRIRRFTISHRNLRNCHFYSFEIDWQTVGSLAEAIKAWNRRADNGT